MAYKKKYKRGERLTTLDEVVQQKNVYLGYMDSPRCRAWVLSMQLNTVLGFLNSPGIYKADRVEEEKGEANADG